MEHLHTLVSQNAVMVSTIILIVSVFVCLAVLFRMCNVLDCKYKWYHMPFIFLLVGVFSYSWKTFNRCFYLL